MDNNTAILMAERSASNTLNNGSPRRMGSQSPGTTRPLSVDAQIVQLVVHRDEKGYGMKVSGDNPVYVQSVKEGGPAEKAGLHAGDKILKVNGITVVTFTHTDVVDLIKSSSEVLLTVQQRTNRSIMASLAGAHGRPLTAHASTTITNPQPVDNIIQMQLQAEKEQHYRLMIEKEQRYIDVLRSQLATSPDEKKFLELTKTEKNLQTLQSMLQRNQTELPHCDSASSPISPETGALPNGNSEPPPLPKRTIRVFGNSTINNRSNTYPLPSHPNKMLNSNEVQVDNPIYYPPPDGPPPPLPPRRSSIPSSPQTPPGDVSNSINKQMSYPLVATCATLVNNYLQSNTSHQRTKSSPESLLNLSPLCETSGRLKSSESVNDISKQESWDPPEAPPGTPPPPYPSPRMGRKDAPDNGDTNNGEDGSNNCSETDSNPMRNRLVDNAVIHAATSQVVQQPIMSMEDDEISDQEMEQSEEHSPFKSLTRLWENPPHLAVFTNYILSNSDPNSLFFYLITDLYKEGNAKEMKKWAFEIHSTFLVPGAPLRLGNCNENVAREIDDVLMKDKKEEEILRKIFWKARARAKEELSRQLVDFKQKRIAGLGTIYGPGDAALSELYHDKSKELRLYESLFIEKLEPYLVEVDKDNYDPKKFYSAAALTTILQRTFGLRLSLPLIERCPVFVNKEKSFKNKFLPGRISRKLSIQGHQFIAQQYYTVILCNNCHQIIYGIGPQGYRCNDCSINLHRQCINLYDDSCPGPFNKKDRGIGKILRIRPHESDHRRKASATNNFLHMERDRRQMEDKDSEGNDIGESKPSQPVSRSGSDRRPDCVREESGAGKNHDGPAGGASPDSTQDKNDEIPIESSVSLPSSGNKKRTASNINRSESVKEQSEKQRKQRRNISDPSQNTSNHHTEQSGLSNTTDSGSSSNSNSSISYNGRLSESPSNPTSRENKSDGDSDMDADSDHINWQDLISTEQLNNLPPHEKKRQDVINELFYTEKSHMRSLNVLHKIFYKPLQKSQVLKPDELSLIFPNIKELLQIHRQFHHEMTKKRREDPIVRNLGDLLLNMFSGNTGEAFKEAAAKFCERQQLALELIKERRKRDSKFDSILTEGEKKRQCRRLQFQAILPVEMQRLSKLPLLLERLIGALQEGNGNEEELNKLNRAYTHSKEIVNHVNEAAKMALNQARLVDIQRSLDQSNFERSNDPISQEFRPLDLTKYKLVREGPMHLRRPNKSTVLVHVLLMEEVVVILHKEGDKYVLKNFQSGTSGQTNPLSPIIKISTLLVRINAVCKNALFLVNTSTMNSQMYDLRAEDDAKRDVWFKHFSDVTDAHNKKEGKTRHNESRPDDDDDDEESIQEFTQPQDVSERAEEVDHVENEESFTAPVSDTSGGIELERDVTPEEEKNENNPESATVEGDSSTGVPSTVTAEEWPLIQPSQVHVAVLPVHQAESRLTPIEQIRRKHEEIKRALKEKENLIADLLSIPQQEFHTIADMVSEEDSNSDSINLTMASIYQTIRLQEIINDTLNISDAGEIQATGGQNISCSSQVTAKSNNPPSIPVSQVQDIVNRLSKHLTELLDKQKQLEDEKVLMRNELYKMREKLHEQLSIHDTSGLSSVMSDANITLENEEEVRIDSETTVES
ncbi:rho guanine nucleotide exchange factor 11 isoform X2 [Harmonia axyridis]|uniref:rho guanine nucleotide exchange factor 11 isoform X2 n=1 Tax=Harmonia axyridis TaxID=115357 RepID=UPI001E275288|nr:rho guanine nucleotide exchange factor 11 isoform X2 [Harmonia axyridis]